MMGSNVVNVIKKRKSIRRYSNCSISDNVIQEILKCGNSAPSGKNRKPWTLNVINDKEVIRKISKYTVYSRFLRNAPVLILVYGRFDDSYLKDKDLISIGCCVQNILLAATSMGCGSCVIGELYDQKIESTAIIKSTQDQLVCGICIGFPKNQKMNDSCSKKSMKH